MLTLALALPASTAQASADPWVPVLVEHADSDRTLAVARQVLAALATEQGVEVLDPAGAARRFERLHSRQPIDMPGEELQRLGSSIDAAIKDGALGKWDDANEKLSGFRELSETAQDYVKAKLQLADDVLLFCLKFAHAKLAAGRKDAAREQMGRCVFASPAQRPRPSEHDSAVLELYDEVRKELLGSELSSLSVDVDSPSTEDCQASVNGNPPRAVPYKEMGLLPTTVRVQVSCQGPGRIHVIKLQPGENALVVDRRLDRTVQTRGLLSLSYASATEREGSEIADAGRLARIMDVSTLLLVGREGDSASLVRVEDRRPTATVRLHLGASDAEVRQAAKMLAESRSGDIEPARAPVAAQTSDSDSETTGTELFVGISLAVLGTASFAAAWVRAAARDDTLQRFSENDNAASFTRYEDQGAQATTFAAGGALLGVLSVVSLLPAEDGVPAWSWVLGGLGAGTAGLGIALWSGGEACNGLGCDPDASDPVLGRVVFFHGAPLLAVPLTHGLRALFDTKQLTVTAERGRDGGTLSLSGRF